MFLVSHQPSVLSTGILNPRIGIPTRTFDSPETVYIVLLTEQLSTSGHSLVLYLSELSARHYVVRGI